jgi:alpha-tubulin suppressor-like RCC1 family protein
MTTKFKDKHLDVDQLYLNRSNYVIGGSLVASGNPSAPWRVNSYFYSNWREPYLGEELGWFKFSYLKNVSPSHAHGSSPLYAFKEDGIYFWGQGDYHKIPGLNGSIHTSSSPLKVFSDSTWKDLQISNTNTFVIKDDGTLWANGDTAYTGLSPILRHNTSSMSLYPGDKWWIQFSADPNDFTNGVAFGLDVNKNLWAIGTNTSGKLGLGLAADVVVSSWTQITGNTWSVLAQVTQNGMLAVDTSGRLWAWGSNSNFRLGTGAAATTNYSKPTQIGTATNWTTCTLSSGQGAGLRAPGLLYAWGDNSTGALGDGTVVTKSTPIQVGTLSSWLYVSASGGTISAIRWSPSMQAYGLLFSSGFNGQGQLGIGSITNRSVLTQAVGTITNWYGITRDAAGSAAYAKAGNGIIYGFGLNTSGELGLGHLNNVSTPVAMTGNPTYNTYRIHNGTGWFSYFTGNLYTTGIPTLDFSIGNRSTPVIFMSTAVLVPHATRGFALVDQVSSRLYIGGTTTCSHYGHNYEQSLFCESSLVQLGTQSWKMMDVWSNFAHFIRSDNTLWTIGNVSGPVLGNGTTTAIVSSLTQVGTNTWATIGGSAWHKLAIDTSGRLWAWGNNAQYQLGRGNNTAVSTPVQVGSSSAWTAVFTAPPGVSYAQQSNVTYVFGSGSFGLLWDSNGATHGYSTPVALATTWSKLHSTGDHHAVGLKPDGTLWGVGYNLSDNRSLEMDRSGYIAYSSGYSIPLKISGKSTWVDVAGWDDQTVGILAGGES